MVSVGLDVGHRNHTFPNHGKGVYRNGKGYAEFDFNRKLGLRLKEILEKHGVTVVTEPNYANKAESLTGRTNFFNARKVDILVSLHANAGVPDAHGRCVFYWHDSSKGKKLATLVRDEVGAKGYSLHGNGLHASVRGSWTDLHMVRESWMPAILIEHGFMSHHTDFELIFGNKQAQYIEHMAEADAKAIMAYFGIAFKGAGTRPSQPVISGKVLYRVQTGAYASKKNAEDLLKELKGKGFDAIVTFDGKLYRVQTGAYSVKDNADGQLKKVKDAGYKDAFITTGSGQFVHTNDGQDAPEAQPKPQKKTVEQIAQEIASGVHSYGNYPTRKTRVEAEGVSYNAVQERVNKILNGSSAPKVSVETVAKEIASGKHSYGNWPERQRIIESKGLNYNQVQTRVNQLLGSGGSPSRAISVGDTIRVKALYSNINSTTNARKSPISGYVASTTSGGRNPIRLLNKKGGYVIGYTRVQDRV